jgi:integrase
MEIPVLLKCPECGSSKIAKTGLRLLSAGKETQTFKCSECSRKFSENYIRCPRQFSTAHYALNGESEKMDSLTEAKTVTGNLENIEIKIAKHHGKMMLQNYKPSTIRLSKSALRTLMKRGADLANPESVKEVMSKQKWSGNRQRNVIIAYTQFLKYLGLSWESPRYSIVRKLPFIPTEQEIDDLIAGSPNTLATFLQLLKETAMRRGEAITVPWKDVDLERRVIMCNYPEKGSNPRIFNELSGKLLNMLSNLPKENSMLFGNVSQYGLKNQLCRTRKRLAFKLGNPRLEAIHMHTFRYWKGTMLYHHKPDILYVAEFLGHKSIENTRLYIQLEKSLFKDIPINEWIIRVAKNTLECCELMAADFEYHTGTFDDGGKIFRKQK